MLALAVVVDGVTRHGLGDALDRLLPSGTSFWALLGVAVDRGGARQRRQQPAGDTGAGTDRRPANLRVMLAVLLGVNIGPNATYPGSLATLLWRRLLPSRRRSRARANSMLLGLSTVPLLLLVAVAALWVALTVIGV